ncbi:hypothetical protein [Streptomyces sp. NPDC091215]
MTRLRRPGLVDPPREDALPDGWIEHTTMTDGRTAHALPGLPAA